MRFSLKALVRSLGNRGLNIKHWWENIDKGKLTYTESNLSQGHFIHHRFHTNRLGKETRSKVRKRE
jgi:hypothetical protein